MALGQFYGISTAGNNGVECRVYVDITDDAANNRSSIDAEIQVRKSNGFTTQGNMSGKLTIEGTGLTISGNKTLPSSGAWVSLGSAGRRWYTHGANGALSGTIDVDVVNVAMNTSGDFDTPINGQLDFKNGSGFTDYNRKPSAPGTPVVTVSTIGTVSLDWTWSAPTSVGGGITEYEFRYSTDSTFPAASTTTKSTGTSRAYKMTALIPGTKYYVSVRAETADGWGSWSGNGSATTLPAVPPGFVVASSPSGSQATLTFSPPGGVTGVTKYVWERRLTGTTSPVATGESTAISTVVTGLVPGNSYDWRASAWIGGYQSPWTDDGAAEWTTLKQAKPNTNPGDYFDGSTPDTVDINYSWTGATDASTSVATASGVDGWEVVVPSGAAIIYRVTAGIFAEFAARVQITADATGAGVRAGQKNGDGYRSEVTPDATYIGSIHVRPSRSQSLAAEITWLNAAFGVISRLPGAATVVAGDTWARLAAGGPAPAGAAWALVRVIDVAGTGWSAWLGGETMDLDGAMLSLNEEFPYFDGDTLPDGTYLYEWVGVSNASVSTRTPLDSVEPGAFMEELGGLFLPSWLAITDPDCTPVPRPPRPPAIPSDCIENVGVWRRYYTEIPADLVPDWLDVVPTLDITTGSKAARQVRIRYYANPDGLPPAQVNTATWISEQIISFMPAKTVMTLDGVTQHVWAEVNHAAPISADHLLYGTNGKPATWPVLSCGIAYLVSIEVPISEPAGNVVVEASLTART